ncbi:MAG: hypothetical protein EA386_15010 [Rhodobacteraceae bacterium]|nr:MAG: hypothetical protein EA386_15010 [Paracoccaceae bacterium]
MRNPQGARKRDLQKGDDDQKGRLMRFIFRFLFLLAILAGVTVVSYAYIGDLSPQREPVETPVTLDAN